GGDEAGRVGLAVKIEFELRLQDEALGEEKIVGGPQLSGKVALAAQIAGELEIEEIRCEPLNAQRCPIAGRARIEITAQPALQIEIGRDGAIVEELLLAIGERAVAEGALRFDP